MIPIRLTLSSFTSYGTEVPELDFSKFHMAAISGSNGAGKSSLLDAITWSLWGSSRIGDSSDQLVRLGAQDMWVEFTFELDGHKFTVKRRRSLKHGGSTALELWSNSNNLTEGTIKATQQKIINLLHLTFETFINSSFLRQGHADEFTTKGPTDRKRILADILGLSHYDSLEEKSKEKIRETAAKLQLLEYQLLEVEAELSQKMERETKKKQAEDEVEKIEKEIKNLEKDLNMLRQEKEALSLANEQRNKLSQNLEQYKNELEEIKQQGIARKNKIDNLKKEIESLNIDEKLFANFSILQNDKELLEKTRQQRLELENQLTQISSGLHLKNQQLENLQSQIKELEDKLANITEATAKCPTCGQLVNDKHKKEIKKSLGDQKKQLEEKMKKIDTQNEQKLIKQLEEKISLLKFDNDKYQEISNTLIHLQNLQKQKERLIEIKATIETEEKVILELRFLFTNKKLQVDKLESEMNSLPDLSGKLQNVNQNLGQLENTLTDLRDKEKSARGLLGQVTELISRSKQLEDLYQKKQQEKSILQKDKEAFEQLALAFGKKGIQAMIIETAIPEIEDEANKLLEKLTAGGMKVRFETQRETKIKLADGEKGIIETLDIVISDELGERPYEMYSGGEAFRVNFAIRLALSKLLTRRAGAKLQFLVIDEGFGTQDQEGRTRIVEVLDTIKNDFEKILIITHLEELKEEFPVRIEVSKIGAGSTFEVVGA